MYSRNERLQTVILHIIYSVQKASVSMETKLSFDVRFIFSDIKKSATFFDDLTKIQ